MLLPITIISFVLALVFLVVFLKKRKEEKEQKGFIILASIALLVFAGPSAIFFIIGAICLALLLGVGGCIGM